MLRRSVLFALAIVVAAVGAGVARAGDLKFDGATNRQGSGGEFRVSGFDDYYTPVTSKMLDGTTGENFHTFCIEGNRNVSLGSTYDYTIEQQAVGGGFSGQVSGGGDPIGEATAKLFYSFWTDTWLSGITAYDSGDGGVSSASKADAEALQRAIWFLEGELTTYLYTGSGGNNASDVITDASSLTGRVKAFVDYALASGTTWAALGHSEWTGGAGGVRALNLWSGSTDVQSQLIVVPLPAGALMGFALLGALGLVKGLRARRKALMN